MHIHTYTYTHTHTHTNTHVHIHTYITTNPKHTPHTAPVPTSPTPNMQLLAGYLQLKLILKSYQNAKCKSNIQRNDITGKSFTHCTVDVMSVVVQIYNEKLLSCPTKTSIRKRGFSQT